MSLSRSEQARLNGAKSRGPKTEAGKARSAANATKHNLSGQGLVILETESGVAFQELHQAFVDKFQPQDAIEIECLLQAAVARWRMRRIWKLETGIFNKRFAEQEQWLRKDWDDVTDEVRQSAAYLAYTDSFAKLNRYERSISREYERAMKNFDRARAERKVEKQQSEPKPEPTCGAGPRPAAASQAAAAPRQSPAFEFVQNQPKTRRLRFKPWHPTPWLPLPRAHETEARC